LVRANIIITLESRARIDVWVRAGRGDDCLPFALSRLRV